MDLIYFVLFWDSNMNDFTKEELQLIHEYLCGNIRTYVLADKVQSIIDNYCEHDFHPVLSPFKIESCHKCMRIK